MLIADNMCDLQELIDVVEKYSANMGLNINIKKTKYMIVTRTPENFRTASITSNSSLIERVNKFKYFGSWLCEDWTSDLEIQCRIENARRMPS